MNRRVLTGVFAVGCCLVSLGVAGRQSGEDSDRAGELMAEIVDLRQKQVEAIILQNQFLADVDPQRHWLLMDAAEDLTDARVRLARHNRDRSAEEAALTELLELSKRNYEAMRAREFGVHPADIGAARARALEAELRLELFNAQ